MMGRKLFRMPELPDDIEAVLAFIEQNGTIENDEEILAKLPSTAKESAERAEKIECAALRIYEYVDSHIYQPSLTKRKNKVGVRSLALVVVVKNKKCCLNKG